MGAFYRGCLVGDGLSFYEALQQRVFEKAPRNAG